MENKIEKELIKAYEPLLRRFSETINGVNVKNLPSPFLPVYGENYELNEYKIAFVGWETRNNFTLEGFSEVLQKDMKEALYWFYDIIDEEEGFPFRDYGNNFGTGFWDFIMKFLASFYNIPIWKDIKNLKYPDILKSFVWGNLDSIERFEVTAKKKGCNFNDWVKVKEASEIFDNAEIFLNVFQPKVTLVLSWQDNDWLSKDAIDKNKTETILSDNILYYYVPKTNSHIYWTHHPGSLSRNKIDFNYINYLILTDINKRKIFEKSVGDEFIKSYNEQLVKKEQRSNLFTELKLQLKNSADALKLSVYDENWGNGSESYFSFYLPDSQFQTYLCFGFEKNYKDFSVGVGIVSDKQDENYLRLKNEISQALVPVIGIDEGYPNWLYLHYYNNEFADWSKNENIWVDISNGEMCKMLMNIINDAIKALNGINY